MDPTLAAHARPNVFEVDLAAIARCVRGLRDIVGPDVEIFAALKSNAYGFGLVPVAQAALAAGADALSLVDRADAIALRVAGVKAPILVYAGSWIDETAVAACEEYDLIPTLLSTHEIETFGRHAAREMPFAVKLNVGQERLGVDAEEIVAFVKAAHATGKLRLAILNAHPHVARGGDPAVLQWQYERFVSACAALEKAGILVPAKLFAASKTLAVTREMNLNAIDPGAALYAPITPSDRQGSPFHALKTRLIQVRKVLRADFVDKAPFPVRDGMVLGVIPIGASDGMARLHAGEVLVRGRRAKIVASPSLEYTRVDVTGIDGAAPGDEVVIIGGQGGERIVPEDVARHQGGLQVSDLAMAVRSTIPRKYLPCS